MFQIFVELTSMTAGLHSSFLSLFFSYPIHNSSNFYLCCFFFLTSNFYLCCFSTQKKKKKKWKTFVQCNIVFLLLLRSRFQLFTLFKKVLNFKKCVRKLYFSMHSHFARIFFSSVIHQILILVVYNWTECSMVERLYEGQRLSYLINCKCQSPRC